MRSNSHRWQKVKFDLDIKKKVFSENGAALNQVAQRAVEEVFQAQLDKALSNPV